MLPLETQVGAEGDSGLRLHLSSGQVSAVSPFHGTTARVPHVLAETDLPCELHTPVVGILPSLLDLCKSSLPQ